MDARARGDAQGIRNPGPAGGADEAAIEAPPAVGRDERRMQVRAYRAWAGLLRERAIPAIADLDSSTLDDFAACSVLLDFSGGAEEPAIRHLGRRLAEEAGACGSPVRLGEIPPGSLLEKAAEHYPRVRASRAPLAFEGDYVDPRGATVLYRGILLPFSSDERTIDFVYGVVNWKHAADRATIDGLRREMAGLLDPPAHRPHRADPLTAWADGPTAAADGGRLARGDRSAPDPFPANGGRAEASPCAAALRRLTAMPFTVLPPTGSEFMLLVARRMPSGEVLLLGEVPEVGPLLERAARALLANGGS